MTTFRIVFTFWNPDTVKALNYSSWILIGAIMGAIFAYWARMNYFVVFGTSAIIGMLYSTYYPYLYALPNYYDKVFTPNNTFNTIIYYAAG